MKSIKIIELFGGIGACTKALERLGVNVEIADYVEIDKYAVRSFNAIHGTNFEPQDIKEWDKDIEADLIMHGSPCQDFSNAGKQAGGDKGSGTRSSLMYETLRIVEKIKPKYVIWENVKNLLSEKHKHNFDAYQQAMADLGYKNYYQVLNAKDYGIPQSRERVFTVSIREDIPQGFKPPEPKPLKNKLKDILEPEVDEKYYLSDKMMKYLTTNSAEQSAKGNGFKFKPTDGSGIATAVCTKAGQRMTDNFIKEPVRPKEDEFKFPDKQPLKKRLRDLLEPEVDEKYYLNEAQIASMKTTGYNKDKPETRIQNEVANTICATDYKKPRCVQIGTIEGINGNDILKRVYDDSGLSPTLSTMQGGNQQPKVRISDAEKASEEEPKLPGAYGRDFGSKGKIQDGKTCGTLQAAMGVGGGNVPLVKQAPERMRIRKLTPKECWRLMGFDDEDFEKAQAVNSNTQLYKQAGNSIVVNVLEAILSNLLDIGAEND